MLNIYVADSQAENLRVILCLPKCRTITLGLPNIRAALFRGTLARGGDMRSCMAEDLGTGRLEQYRIGKERETQSASAKLGGKIELWVS